MRRRVIASRQSVLAWLAVAGLLTLQVQLLTPFSEPATTQPGQASVEANYAKLPLAFEPNQGQAGNGVDFLVHHGQAMTAFSGTSSTTSVGGKQVTMSLNGANSASFTGQDELPSKTNYFLGNDQSQWRSDVPNFQKLLAKNVYPGIDLAYYGTNSSLEHDFIVSPNADYRQIAFNFSGQDTLSQDTDGNLVLKAGDDQLQLNAPTTYQLGEHERHTIPSKFEVHGDTVTIAVASDYDPTKPLVIDPVLIYSTYFGGSGNDVATRMSLDPSGNAYLYGYTTSSNLPTSSPYQASYAGNTDTFVTKLNQTGSALVYSTYLGGSGTDNGFGLTVDILGNAYVSGNTNSTNFPTASAIQASNGGLFDAFLTKLNPSGSALVYSTYLGGSQSDGASGIALDSSNNVYLAGFTFSSNFPTASPIQASNGGNYDVFVSKVNAAGSSLVYSTYVGGSGRDQAGRIALDSSNNAYVICGTGSTNFPTVSPYQASKGTGDDACAFKINAAGSALVYSTYLGGSGNDDGRDIAVDSSGNAYVIGVTAATNFPTVSPYQASNGGGADDGFLAKFNAAGSALTYSTYLGGSGDEQFYSLALDSSSNIYVAGFTASSNFPTASAIQSSYGGGASDGFLTKFNAAGSALVYSTYLGGSGDDASDEVKLGLNGDAYIGGYTTSTNFTMLNPYQASNGGAYDSFMLQLTEHTVNLTARVDPTLTFTVGSTTCALGTLSTTQTQQCTYTLTAATNGTSGYSISYLPVTTLTSGANTITALTSPTASTLNTEQFGINLASNTAAGSHTAANFGAVPSGGSGTASADYTTANSFKLNTAGETIATASAPSLTTTYTVSTIANIANTTEAGSYTTTFTYNIVSTY